MKSIKINIEIPESEYKNWSEFESDGEIGVKYQLNSDFRDACRRLYIENYELNIDINE